MTRAFDNKTNNNTGSTINNFIPHERSGSEIYGLILNMGSCFRLASFKSYGLKQSEGFTLDWHFKDRQSMERPDCQIRIIEATP